MKQKLSTKSIWELLSAKLRGFILSRVHDENVASDLVQETFLRIHKSLDTIDDDSRVESWVFQIARHLIADYYRSQKKTATPLGIEPENGTEKSDNMNDRAAGWIAEMIGQLPDTYREAVRLYEMEHLPQQEIADRLGITLSGTKSRIQRGRELIKASLDACCKFEFDARGNILDYEKKNTTACCDTCDD